MKRCDQCEYDFTLILSGITPETPGVEDALFDAGCDDATFAFRRGRPVLTFSRRADSLKFAIFDAIKQVRGTRIGIDVIRVENCNLVTIADIARKTERTRQVIHQYTLGKRGPGGFPSPACEIYDGRFLWYWCEVAFWLFENDMVTEDVANEACEVDAINNQLDLEQLRKTHPGLMEEVARKVGGC